MPTAKAHASAILAQFEQAQIELVGKAVVLTDGKAGTVENIWLDKLHGLRISIKGHEGKWPVSTIKFAQSQQSATDLMVDEGCGKGLASVCFEGIERDRHRPLSAQRKMLR